MTKETLLESAVLGSVEGFATESLSCLMNEQLPLDLGVDIEHYLVKSLSVELVTIVWQSYCQHAIARSPAAAAAATSSSSQLDAATPVSPDKLPRTVLPVVFRCLFHTLSNAVIHLSSEELRHLFF